MVNIEMVSIVEIDYLVPDSSYHLPLFLVQQAPKWGEIQYKCKDLFLLMEFLLTINL